MSQVKIFQRAAMCFAMFVVAAVAATTAKADPVNFVLTGPDFSGSNEVTGSMTVNIVNIAGGVRITISNVDLNGFVSQLYLNTSFAPLAGASASCVNCAAIGGAGGLAVSFGDNAFQADGDGRYDILIDLPTDAANRLIAGESIVFDVFSTTVGFDSDSFLAFSLDAGGHGPFQTAAHIQGTGPLGANSDWITNQPVPEPATMLLFGTGLLGIAAGVRRRFRR
jgi:hypothetical protein